MQESANTDTFWKTRFTTAPGILLFNLDQQTCHSKYTNVHSSVYSKQ